MLFSSLHCKSLETSDVWFHRSFQTNSRTAKVSNLSVLKEAKTKRHKTSKQAVIIFVGWHYEKEEKLEHVTTEKICEEE